MVSQDVDLAIFSTFKYLIRTLTNTTVNTHSEFGPAALHQSQSILPRFFTDSFQQFKKKKEERN